MKKSLSYLVLAACIFSIGFGCSKSLEPVKDIQISGMPLDTKTMIFSKLNTPVAADALVQVPGKQESITVNIFPSSVSGIVNSGIKPEVILASDTDHFKLDQTMSKKNLTKGTYLMNIVYGGKTERVLFSVK
ncbi:MAG: hypothetical protein ACYSWP_19275 [Planctomycetota bacterium]